MLQRCVDCSGESLLREYLSQVLLDETDESSYISFRNGPQLTGPRCLIEFSH